jgi:TMEM175 potassium channel family protein
MPEMMATFQEEPDEKETGRLEAFSDGVFAVAVTLLVFEFKVPEIGPALATPETLGRALLQQWPSYFAFVTSFFTILVMWVHHHTLFKNVCKCDAWVHFANGCLLLTIVFVPYPTSLVARFLETPAAKTAVAFYCALFVVVAICFNLVLRATFRKKLLLPSTPMDFVARTCRHYLVGPPLYLLAFLTAFWDVRLSLLICTALWIFWAASIMTNTRA